jgi:hypothetical protein
VLTLLVCFNFLGGASGISPVPPTPSRSNGDGAGGGGKAFWRRRYDGLDPIDAELEALLEKIEARDSDAVETILEAADAVAPRMVPGEYRVDVRWRVEVEALIHAYFRRRRDEDDVELLLLLH